MYEIGTIFKILMSNLIILASTCILLAIIQNYIIIKLSTKLTLVIGIWSALTLLSIPIFILYTMWT